MSQSPEWLPGRCGEAAAGLTPSWEVDFGEVLPSRTLPSALSEALLKLSEELLPLSEPVEIFLFGSRAKGTADPRSDFDIGIRSARALDGRQMAEIRDRLEALPILQTVDIVDFSCVSPEFEAVATRDRIVIYERKA